MYEELLEPAKIYFGNNSIPSCNKELVIQKCGEDSFLKFNLIKNDFYKSNAYMEYKQSTGYNLKLVEEKAINDFNKLHPNCNKKLIKLFCWGYCYLVWHDGYCEPDL